MPGLSFVCDFKGVLHEKRYRVLTSLDSVMHYEEYEKTILVDEKFYLLACTGYKEYPVACIDNEKFLIYLEGKIYGKDQLLINKELELIAEWVFASEKKEDIADWLLNTDGEFFVAILNKSMGSICFLNDVLGRLPVYYSKIADELIVSREFRFVANLNDTGKFDRMAVAQYLLFDYPLGKRTLLDNVHRLAPASVIKIDMNRAQVQVTQLHSFNFELKQHPHKTLEENTNELVKLLSEGCINRASDSNSHGPNRRIILGLSGGLDSRTVAVGLQNNNIPFLAVTRLDYLRNSSSDAEIAERLATALDIEWKLLRLEPTRGRDLLKLLRMKNGLNYLGLAFILPFFAKVRNAYGAGIFYFTGDGGDKVLRDLRPCWKLRSLDGLVNFIVSRNQRFSLQKVSAVTRIPPGEILEELKSHVSSFPESNWSQKYVHFLFSERCFKLLFEAEDKNRFLFWSVTPFYSIRFFRYAMECPDEQKEKFALYRNLLLTLSPVAASITYAGWRLPIAGNQYLVYLFIRFILDRIPPALKKSVKNIRAWTQRRALDNHRACLHDQLNKCVLLNKYLDARLLGQIASNCNKSEITILLTIASAIEESGCRQSTLSKYSDVQFA